jgi:hypothetical protein
LLALRVFRVFPVLKVFRDLPARLAMLRVSFTIVGPLSYLLMVISLLTGMLPVTLPAF